MGWSISTQRTNFGALRHIACVAHHTDGRGARPYKHGMCFSSEASFTTSVVLLLVGAASVRRTRSLREWPYALIPLCFAMQQLLEGGLWLSLDQPQACFSAQLTLGYSVFSQVFWPVYIPLAVYLLEPAGLRRRFIGLIGLGGSMVGAYLAWYMAQIPVLAQVRGGHIAYVFPHFHQPLATALYLCAACVAPLASHWRPVRWFGICTSLSLLATAYFYAQWFISTWCFFASWLSVLVWLYFAKRPPTAQSA